MSPRVLLRRGVRSLLLTKLRPSLSILGGVFGVAAVVAMSAVGEGARRESLQQIADLGIDSITVRGRSSAPGAPPAGGLTLRDAESVAHVVPGAIAVAPLRETALSVEAGARHTEAAVVGTTPDYQAAARLPVASGRFLSLLDVQDRKRGAVLRASLPRPLLPPGDPRGERRALGGD